LFGFELLGVLFNARGLRRSCSLPPRLQALASARYPKTRTEVCYTSSSRSSVKTPSSQSIDHATPSKCMEMTKLGTLFWNAGQSLCSKARNSVLERWSVSVLKSSELCSANAGQSLCSKAQKSVLKRCSVSALLSSGRIIMGSDGLWDAISNKRADRIACGKPAPEVARHLVKVRATYLQEGKSTVTT
jgi:hypothetical protein